MPPEVNLNAVVDPIIAPLHRRLVVAQGGSEHGYPERLVRMVAAAARVAWPSTGAR